MTIAIAVKTGSAVVFAADSKTTTQGVVGFEQDGTPRWVEQTYDNATKVVADRSNTMMAMVAGAANVGRVTATDIISGLAFPVVGGEVAADQDKRVRGLIDTLVAEKAAYWGKSKVPPDQWPGPTILLAAPGQGETGVRVWRAELMGADATVSEVLKEPYIRLEGSYGSAFSLLYGYEPEVLDGLRMELKLTPEQMAAAMGGLKVLRPVEKLNLWAMPAQDAIELAVFLAHLQIQMERFLPGNPLCGGPVDVMLLQTAPDPGIVAFPGKVLHHPGGVVAP